MLTSLLRSTWLWISRRLAFNSNFGTRGVNYRSEARKCLARADAELSTVDDERIKYAALELRMAMEALTYDRAKAYKQELPPSEYETWQPKKLMQVLLDIDPTADANSSLAFGKEAEPGTPPATMQSLGSEQVLNLKILRRHYDALGSFLHLPSLAQTKTGAAPDLARLRSRCGEIAEFVRSALSSPVFNITFGNFATFSCVGCGSPVRRRLPPGQDTVHAECYECRATYTLEHTATGEVASHPHQVEITCRNESCEGKILVWQHEIEPGQSWPCPDCKGTNTLGVGVAFKPSPANDE